MKPGDEVTGEEACILFVRLRWTRSGFKALMHLMNGSDKFKPPLGSRAVTNCTDNELTFFLGIGLEGELEAGNNDADRDEHAALAAARHVERLWNDPLVPSSWTKDKGPAGLEAAHAVYPRLATMAREERRRRARGGQCRRDALSKADLQLPKGAVDQGETPWTAALRELREEAGVAASEVRRAELAPGIRAGQMTAFVVTLEDERTAAKIRVEGVRDDKEGVLGAQPGTEVVPGRLAEDVGPSGTPGATAGGWKVEGSPETVASVWVPVSDLGAVHTVRLVREVLDKVLPNLATWVPPRRGKSEEKEEEEEEEEGDELEGVKRARRDVYTCERWRLIS